ncbi:multi-sensor signal transduction histidine kinase [Halobiforma nitratireducens JCM 10879]|uniref:histidine kinase n=1 Tax=Halobiforma nitratireducens JCM 10879 TaxID=1227454 RepID=M0M5P1_9EURY|nr:multi-sensor signal transduction histidine kinase [Halobiforma nitratireducens JCM 10879]
MTSDAGRLRSFVTELESCSTVDEVYDLALSAAADLVGFDAAILCTIENDVFVPRAVDIDRLLPGEPLSHDEGVAGRTVSEGTAYLVDDIDDLEGPSSGDDTTDVAFRSLLSIPLGDDGVLQFHAEEVGAFSDPDRQVGELIAAAVVNARRRLESEQAVERQRDKFAALFQNVSDAALQYYTQDGTYRIEAVNSAFVRVFGYEGEDVVGDLLGESVMPDDDPTERELIDGSLPDHSDNGVEVVRATASGPRSFLLRHVPFATGDETTAGYLIYTDLTELKERERELERKTARLDQFASVLSHDLRNPLNVADGYLEAARQSDDPTAELEEIERSLDRMERIIDDVLTLARSGGDIDDCDAVDLEQAAREAWENVSTPDASLDIEPNGRVRADRSRLLRLLENLFRNAIEHGSPDSSADGGGVAAGCARDDSEMGSDCDCDSHSSSEPAVRVRVEPLEEGFAVEDDGPGIPPDERDTVFESGYTTGDGNTGFGLAIVEQISEAHGWRIDLTDGADGGARFEFHTTSDAVFSLGGDEIGRERTTADGDTTPPTKPKREGRS